MSFERLQLAAERVLAAEKSLEETSRELSAAKHWHERAEESYEQARQHLAELEQMWEAERAERTKNIVVDVGSKTVTEEAS